MKNDKKTTTPKVHIIDRVFLGKINLEDYLQKEVELLLEKYKTQGYKG